MMLDFEVSEAWCKVVISEEENRERGREREREKVSILSTMLREQLELASYTSLASYIYNLMAGKL